MAIAPTNGNKALYLWGMNDTPGELVINAGGILKADCANVENHGTITVYGTMELGKLGDAPKLAGVGANNGGWKGHLIVDGKDGEGIVSVAHNQLNFGGGNTSVDWQEPAGDCSVDIINGGKITTAAVSFRNGAKNTLTINNGTLEFTNDPDYADLTPRYFDNQGIINVTNGTLDMSDRNFDNTGSLTIAGSSFTVGETLTNNGTVTVTGESTLKITDRWGWPWRTVRRCWSILRYPLPVRLRPRSWPERDQVRRSRCRMPNRRRRRSTGSSW